MGLECSREAKGCGKNGYERVVEGRREQAWEQGCVVCRVLVDFKMRDGRACGANLV